MRKFLILALFCAAGNFHSQQSTTAKTYLKANAVFLPVGMLNVAVEERLGHHTTIQPEIFISPWKSFFGKYMQFYTAGVDGRYYFSEAFKHWYLGANISFSRFILQKWNYWSSTPYQYEPTSPVYTTSDLYQNGFSVMFGAVAGYQFQVNDKWNLDFYVGGGSAQSFYRGFHKELGVRYDTDPTRDYNRSGEWIPYRGGLMVSYKLR